MGENMFTFVASSDHGFDIKYVSSIQKSSEGVRVYMDRNGSRFEMVLKPSEWDEIRQQIINLQKQNYGGIDTSLV